LSGLRLRLDASLRRLCQAPARPEPQARRSGLAERITGIADDLAGLIDDADQLRLAAPTPVTNAVLDLRAWSVRVFDHPATRPTTIDATGLLAYIRTLPDRQLLALLADLPWARLDALLDAVQVSDHASSGGGAGR
jgi:mRNA-degrading endonuclease toxin of MazEF toxin-antitoxin module